MADILKFHISFHYIKFKTKATAKKWYWGYTVVQLVEDTQKNLREKKKENQLTLCCYTPKFGELKESLDSLLQIRFPSNVMDQMFWASTISKPLVETQNPWNSPWCQGAHNAGEKILCKSTVNILLKRLHHTQALWSCACHLTFPYFTFLNKIKMLASRSYCRITRMGWTNITHVPHHQDFW